MTRLVPNALALAVALAAPAAAQDAEPGMAGPVETRDASQLVHPGGIKVENAGGTEIAQIETVLIDSEGQPAGYLLALGEFFDFTGRTVGVPLEALSWNGAHYVSKMTEAQLQNLEPFDE
jgi:hypothetical protein